MEHNNALQDRETNVWSQLEAAKVSVFDVHALISEYLANPELYGLDNVVDNCADDSTGMVGASACENPDKYLWWDKYHPTTNVQKSMSHAVKVAVEALQ
ncbi:hypothetical protein BC830DRAFT_1093681 [Chytriomyces sp. MP71]|nr:hypothetical protein BC830DRAFT_1093681 [Chytriomyces sp. MP71]